MTGKSEDKNTLAQVQKSILQEVPEDTKKKMERMLDGFRQDLAAHPYLKGRQTTGNRIWQFSLPFTNRRNRFILIVGAGLVCLAVLMTIIFFSQTPTWAEVEEQFGIIEYCSISVYLRDNPFSNPLYGQYWFDRDGRARMHIRSYVIFQNKDFSVQSFDIKNRQRSFSMLPLDNFLRGLERARKSGTSTLRSIMEAMYGDGLIDTTKLLISDPQVAQDLLVFDAQSRDTLWWLRAWALRESKLPVRILKWHQNKGRYVELIFSYSKEQPPEFFDPDAFAAALRDPSVDSHQLLNLYLQDPGGQAFPTPGS